MSNTMIGYMVMMSPDGCFVKEQELAGPNPSYYETRKEAQKQCDYWNEVMSLNKDKD